MSEYPYFIKMGDLSPTQIWLCGHHYSNFLSDFMGTFKASALSQLYDQACLSCIVWWQVVQYLTDSHYHPPTTFQSIKLAISGSFKTAGQSTTTIFISRFHTGIQTSSLFWPHAYFSFKSSVQHLVAHPACTALLLSSSYHVCTETHPLPSGWNGHTLLVFLLSSTPEILSLPSALV